MVLSISIGEPEVDSDVTLQALKAEQANCPWVRPKLMRAPVKSASAPSRNVRNIPFRNVVYFLEELDMAKKADNKIQGSGGAQGGHSKGSSKKEQGRKSSGNKKGGT